MMVPLRLCRAFALLISPFGCAVIVMSVRPWLEYGFNMGGPFANGIQGLGYTNFA